MAADPVKAGFKFFFHSVLTLICRYCRKLFLLPAPDETQLWSLLIGNSFVYCILKVSVTHQESLECHERKLAKRVKIDSHHAKDKRIATLCVGFIARTQCSVSGNTFLDYFLWRTLLNHARKRSLVCFLSCCAQSRRSMRARLKERCSVLGRQIMHFRQAIHLDQAACVLQHVF